MVVRLRAAIAALDSFCRVVVAVVCAAGLLRAEAAVSGREDEVVLVPNLDVAVLLVAEDIVEICRRCTIALAAG